MSDVAASIQEEMHRRQEDLAYPVVDNYRVFAGSRCSVTRGPHLVEQHSGSTGWQCVWCDWVFKMLPWTVLKYGGAGRGNCDQCGTQYYQLNRVETHYKTIQALCDKCTYEFVSGDYQPRMITLPAKSNDHPTSLNERLSIENVIRRLNDLEDLVADLKAQVEATKADTAS